MSETIASKWVGNETERGPQEPLVNPCRLTRPQVTHPYWIVKEQRLRITGATHTVESTPKHK